MRQIIRAALCAALAAPFAAPLPVAAAGPTSDRYASQFVYRSTDSTMAAENRDAFACGHAAEPQIRAFACARKKQDQKALGRLGALAKALKVRPPAEISEPEKDIIHRLTLASGQDYDLRYTSETANALSQAIRRYEAAAKQVDEPRVLGFIAERLPMLQQAYDKARQTEALLPARAPHLWGITASNDHPATMGPIPRFHGY